MMILFQILVTGLQINRLCRVDEVQHLFPNKRELIQLESVDFIKGNIVPTKFPDECVLCMESTRLHFFLHTDGQFSNCFWDKCTREKDKKEIVINMLNWMTKNGQNPVYDPHYNFFNHEDNSVFTEVFEEIQNIENEL